MRPTLEQANAFLAHRPLPGVSFEHNAPVRVISGEHVGGLGAIICVDDLGEDPVYRVELVSGGDVFIRQSCLNPYEVSSRDT